MNRLLGPRLLQRIPSGVDARQGGNQAERLVPQVLGLVDNDGHIGQLSGIGVHQVPRGPVGVFLLNQAVGRQVRAVGLEDLPDAGALGTGDRGSASPSGYMQILVPAEGRPGPEPPWTIRPGRTPVQGPGRGPAAFRGLVPCLLPARGVPVVHDSLREVVLVQEAVDPLVEVDHLHAFEVFFICDEVLEAALQVRGQIGREGQEQDLAVGHPCPVPCEPLGPVHGNYGLARASTTQNADGAIPVAVDQPPLRGVQETPATSPAARPASASVPPRCPQPKGGPVNRKRGQGRVDVVRIHVRGRGVQFVEGFLVRVPRQQHLDRGLGLQGESDRPIAAKPSSSVMDLARGNRSSGMLSLRRLRSLNPAKQAVVGFAARIPFSGGGRRLRTEWNNLEDARNPD